MEVSALFERVSERLLAEDQELESGRMFASEGLKTEGRFFAMVSKGELVVKLPAERVDQLMARSDGERSAILTRR